MIYDLTSATATKRVRERNRGRQIEEGRETDDR